MDSMLPRQSRQDAPQDGLRQYVQLNLPPDRFDQNCFCHPRHRSLGAVVLPTSFDPSVWRGRHPVSPCPHLNARIASRALDFSLFYFDDGIAADDVAAVGPFQFDDLTDDFPAELLQHANARQSPATKL